MQESITPFTVANTVRMLRDEHQGTICIVEGGDDRKLFSALLHPYCKFVIAFGWENATGAIAILNGEESPGVLAVLDADSAHFEGRSPEHANLFWSDCHDMEIDLLTSGAFERVVVELCDRERVPHPPADELRDELLRAAAPLGYLRLHSTRTKLFLRFRGLTYSEFIDKATLTIDKILMVKAVKDRSQRPDLNDRELLKAISELVNQSHDLRLVCRGHDVTEIFALSLRKRYARYGSSGEVSAERIESALRTAYAAAYFICTRLYKLLMEWQNNNRPFVVLREQPSPG